MTRIAPIAAIVALGCSSSGAPGSASPPPKSVPPAVTAGPMSEASIMADVHWLCDPARRGRGSYQPGGRAAATWVKARLAAAGFEVSEQPLRSAGLRYPITNVIGIHRGTGPGERALIVSAHYDHLGEDEHGVVYPGADDNASGVAVMLAMARHAARHRYRHTILFIAFGAEEAGLVGSLAYINQPRWPLDRTIGIINFDMVGRRFVEAAVDRDGAAAVIGLEADPRVATATERAAARAGLALIPMPAKMVRVFGFHFRTDEWWFRRRGMLAVHFTTGFHRDYHQPSDTPDRLVPGQMRRVARTAAGLMDYLAGVRTP